MFHSLLVCLYPRFHYSFIPCSLLCVVYVLASLFVVLHLRFAVCYSACPVTCLWGASSVFLSVCLVVHAWLPHLEGCRVFCPLREMRNTRATYETLLRVLPTYQPYLPPACRPPPSSYYYSGPTTASFYRTCVVIGKMREIFLLASDLGRLCLWVSCSF